MDKTYPRFCGKTSTIVDDDGGSTADADVDVDATDPEPTTGESAAGLAGIDAVRPHSPVQGESAAGLAGIDAVGLRAHCRVSQLLDWRVSMLLVHIKITLSQLLDWRL